MATTAAQPKRLRALDAPTHAPMRPAKADRRNPSAEDKKVRQQQRQTPRTATIISQDAWRLAPGDYIQGPNNNPVKVNQVRQHKTDANQVYVDTEAGTFAVPRTQSFNLLPGGKSNLQQELPTNLGTPGGNSNTLPGGAAGQGGDAGQSGKSHKCPIDGSPMQLRNTGGVSMWVCPLDGYTQQAASFPGTGGGGGATMDPTMLSNSASRRTAVAKNAAMDEGAASRECPLCGGRTHYVDDDAQGRVHQCEDCGTNLHVQPKQMAAGKTSSVLVPVSPNTYASPHQSALQRRVASVLKETR